MRYSESGLILKKAELTALLGFCSKDKERPHLCVVQFRVRDGRVYAYATDGKRAVEADGHAVPTVVYNEWTVRRECLDQARRALDGSQVLRLAFSFASLNEAYIEEQGLEVASLSWPEDAASSQASFPAVDQIVRLPHASGEVARCAGIAAQYLADIRLMAKAANVEAVDCYPPRTNRDPAYFRANGEDTTWTAVVMPALTEASEEEAKKAKRRKDERQEEMFGGDEAAATPPPRATTPVEAALQDLKDLCIETGTTMTVTGLDGKETVVVDGRAKANGKRASKKASKKTSKKRGVRAEARV
jgi:hypothetical protein